MFRQTIEFGAMLAVAKRNLKRFAAFFEQFHFIRARSGNCAVSGFTLIETLVSVVILSVGIVMILLALDSSVRALNEAREHTWGFRTASELLEEARLSFAAGAGPGIGMTSGFSTSPHGNYRWELRTFPTSLPDGIDGEGDLFKVTATVWREGGVRRKSVTTVIGVPSSQEEDL